MLCAQATAYIFMMFELKFGPFCDSWIEKQKADTVDNGIETQFEVSSRELELPVTRQD
jgi:hypothetical protein